MQCRHILAALYGELDVVRPMLTNTGEQSHAYPSNSSKHRDQNTCANQRNLEPTGISSWNTEYWFKGKWQGTGENTTIGQATDPKDIFLELEGQLTRTYEVKIMSQPSSGGVPWTENRCTLSPPEGQPPDELPSANRTLQRRRVLSEDASDADNNDTIVEFWWVSKEG